MQSRIFAGLVFAQATAVLCLGAATFVAACRPTASAGSDTTRTSARRDGYYCPMHPSYRSDKPGDCPICNMKLVPVDTGEETMSAGSAGGVAGRASVAIPLDLQKRIGLRTVVVAREPFSRTIRAAARVEIDEARRSAVNLRYGGWIEELFVRAVGDSVHPGDRLLSLYSPELYEAQASYQVARGALSADDPAVRSARERLRLWDMTEDQLAALEAGGDPAARTFVYAKTGGVVTRRDAVLGMRVEPGATLFEIADLRTLWVIADVYENEIPLVRVGSQASIELASLPGARVSGRVSFVYPILTEATRTARVRIEVDNSLGTIRPGSFATVQIASELGEQLVVDVDAVLDTGTRRIAFVEKAEGIFEPREVELGARGGGRAVVISGLEAGERVVASATFLVDSESRLKAALHRPPDGSGEHAGHGGH